MLYLIGLGLNEMGYSKEAYEAILKADKVYLESYTVEFPYEKEKLEKQFKKEIIIVNRDFIEGLKFFDEAKNKEIVLLIYGSPLSATTHITIIQEAKKFGIRVKVLHAGSVFDAVAETGLQPYKFGKITSLPNFPADSYMEIVKANLDIKAHTLILIDIELKFEDAVKKLVDDCVNKNLKLDKIIVCSRLGNDDSKIFYDTTDNLKSLVIKAPFCIIIPGELHFMERDFLETL